MTIWELVFLLVGGLIGCAVGVQYWCRTEFANVKYALVQYEREHQQKLEQLDHERSEIEVTANQAHAVLREADRLIHMLRADCKRNEIEVDPCDD